MKNFILEFYSTIFTLYYRFRFHSIKIYNSILFRNKLAGINNNNAKFNQVKLKRTKIVINGINNNIELQKCYMEKSNITIIGSNNLITISPNARINSTQVIIRGNHCKVSIGSNTTFGSAYIVCMGYENYIQIGDECMFAENIEIWNSDSHPIFDEKKNLINPSSPICIANHVWCGKGSKILKGVTIGSNAVIGMEALVTKNIAPNTINVGIPARTIQKGINWDRNFISK